MSSKGPAAEPSTEERQIRLDWYKTNDAGVVMILKDQITSLFPFLRKEGGDWQLFVQKTMDAKYRAAAWNNKDGKFNCHGLYTSADTYGHALHKLYIFFQKYYPDQTKLINEAMDDLDKKCNVIRGLNERQRQVPSGSIRLRRKDKYLEGETIEEKDLLSSESHKDIPVYETDTETVGTA